MTSATVHKNFLIPKLCSEILDHAKNNFRLDHRIVYSNWHASINESSVYEKDIKQLIEGISPFEDFHITWINLTEYEDGRDLELHYDERSAYTFTIVLTDNFQGGRFVVEDTRYELKQGDCISFNGAELLHGVEPVTAGYRAALNIWIKPGARNLL